MLGNTIIARKGSTDASNVPQFILNGFVPNEIPTPTGSSQSRLLYLSVPKLLFEGYDTGFESDVFAMPAKGTRISWQIFGDAVTEVNLLGSEDGINFIQLDQATSASLRTLRSNVAFIQVEVVDGLDVSVLINVKQGRKP